MITNPWTTNCRNYSSLCNSENSTYIATSAGAVCYCDMWYAVYHALWYAFFKKIPQKSTFSSELVWYIWVCGKTVVLRRFELRSDAMLTECWRNADGMLTECWRHCWPDSDPILTECWRHCWPDSDRILTGFWPHADWILTAWLYHPKTRLGSTVCTRLLFWILQKNVKFNFLVLPGQLKFYQNKSLISSEYCHLNAGKWVFSIQINITLELVFQPNQNSFIVHTQIKPT